MPLELKEKNNLNLQTHQATPIAETMVPEVVIPESVMRPLMMAGPDHDDDGQGGDAGVLTKTKPRTKTKTKTKAKTKKPSMYKVLLLNDDYTPMEFVVHILQSIFNKAQDDAVKIMLHVHQKGVGVCGVYPYEVAKIKVTQVMDLAKMEQHPLQCTLEKDG